MIDGDPDIRDREGVVDRKMNKPARNLHVRVKAVDVGGGEALQAPNVGAKEDLRQKKKAFPNFMKWYPLSKKSRNQIRES